MGMMAVAAIISRMIMDIEQPENKRNSMLTRATFLKALDAVISDDQKHLKESARRWLDSQKNTQFVCDECGDKNPCSYMAHIHSMNKEGRLITKRVCRKCCLDN